MSASPFDDPAIRTRIQVEAAGIQARWLEEDAEPTEGDYDTKVVQTLVERLDAQAMAYSKQSGTKTCCQGMKRSCAR